MNKFPGMRTKEDALAAAFLQWFVKGLGLSEIDDTTMECHLNTFKEDFARIVPSKPKEELKTELFKNLKFGCNYPDHPRILLDGAGREIKSFTAQDVDEFALGFAEYLQSKAWESDYREQYTHTHKEHLEAYKRSLK